MGDTHTHTNTRTHARAHALTSGKTANTFFSGHFFPLSSCRNQLNTSLKISRLLMKKIISLWRLYKTAFVDNSRFAGKVTSVYLWYVCVCICGHVRCIFFSLFFLFGFYINSFVSNAMINFDSVITRESPDLRRSKHR